MIRRQFLQLATMAGVGGLAPLEGMEAGATISNILGDGGSIARRLGSLYEFRLQQLERAEAVQSALQTGHHLMVEAGTGRTSYLSGGKTLRNSQTTTSLPGGRLRTRMRTRGSAPRNVRLPPQHWKWRRVSPLR